MNSLIFHETDEGYYEDKTGTYSISDLSTAYLKPEYRKPGFELYEDEILTGTYTTLSGAVSAANKLHFKQPH